MSPVEIQFLLGLFFIGNSFPGMFDSPISRATLIQFIFGALLFVLAFLHISLIR